MYMKYWVNTYCVSTQGIDEHMLINVHNYYYAHTFVTLNCLIVLFGLVQFESPKMQMVLLGLYE